MAKLNSLHCIPTIDALKTAMEHSNNNKQNLTYFPKPVNIVNKDRHYLGMSAIGHECERSLFYSFREAAEREISSQGLLAIQDGHIQEQLFIDRINIFLPEINLITEERGEQIAFLDHDGHYSGHADGVIKGILEAPETWHIWEHKSVNEVKFKKLQKLCSENEKSALKNWDLTYYAQAQEYMYYSGLTRHYLTVSSPGGRDYTSCRTDYNKKDADYYVKRAFDIINCNKIPVRLSEKPEFYRCKWCQFQDICHFNKVPEVNCKTCKSFATIEKGEFYCNKKACKIENIEPCPEHIFNPDLINLKVLKQDPEFTLYEIDKKNGFCNCGIENSKMEAPDDCFLINSFDLKEQVKNFDNLSVEKIREFFGGEIIEEKIETVPIDASLFNKI